MPPMPRRRTLTTREVADRLGITPASVTALARRGEMGRKVDGLWQFTETELRYYQQAQENRARVRALLRRGRPGATKKKASRSQSPRPRR
jgi:hypothetical protein